MKRWMGIVLLVTVLAAAVLLVPFSARDYLDGEITVYSALAYQFVRWDDPQGNRLLWFPRDREAVKELWENGWAPENAISFVAEIKEISGDMVTVEPVAGSRELKSADRITLSKQGLADLGATLGTLVEIYYDGAIQETYPARIHPYSWKITQNFRHMPYRGTWLDSQKAEEMENIHFGDLIITEIYQDCFLACSAMPLPYTVKVNGTLPEEWCVGDQIMLTCEGILFEAETNRYEVSLVDLTVGTWEPEPGVAYKPVIYLYPQRNCRVSVALDLKGELTCTYPAYGDGWEVTARPDGTLTDDRGMEYNCLYWEGTQDTKYDFSQGFCVAGEDTAAFLEDTLEKLGLNRREANEFLVYWLPQMQENPYNLISFQTERYTQTAQLHVEPEPDTVIRVFMAWMASDVPVSLAEQTLEAPERVGFTVVEWGGTQVK